MATSVVSSRAMTASQKTAGSSLRQAVVRGRDSPLGPSSAARRMGPGEPTTVPIGLRRQGESPVVQRHGRIGRGGQGVGVDVGFQAEAVPGHLLPMPGGRSEPGGLVGHGFEGPPAAFRRDDAQAVVRCTGSEEDNAWHTQTTSRGKAEFWNWTWRKRSTTWLNLGLNGIPGVLLWVIQAVIRRNPRGQNPMRSTATAPAGPWRRPKRGRMPTSGASTSMRRIRGR